MVPRSPEYNTSRARFTPMLSTTSELLAFADFVLYLVDARHGMEDGRSLDHVRALAQPRRIGECDRQPAELDRLPDDVASRPRDRRDDGTIGSHEPVEQRRLPGVRLTEDHRGDAGARGASTAECRGDLAGVIARTLHARPRLLPPNELVTLLGEIERGLQPRDHMQKRVSNRRRLAAQQTFDVAQRQLGLKRRSRIHEIGDRFGLNEIELSVQDRALGELARLRDLIVQQVISPPDRRASWPSAR